MLENDPRREVFPEGVEGGLHAPPPPHVLPEDLPRTPPPTSPVS